jgi:hypothetical protein
MFSLEKEGEMPAYRVFPAALSAASTVCAFDS